MTTDMTTKIDPPVAEVAKAFHEAYERLAPEYGYETRKASAVPWEQVPENNRSLMVAVVRDIWSIIACHFAEPSKDRSIPMTTKIDPARAAAREIAGTVESNHNITIPDAGRGAIAAIIARHFTGHGEPIAWMVEGRDDDSEDYAYRLFGSEVEAADYANDEVEVVPLYAVQGATP
jgi:hypothetical protein